MQCGLHKRTMWIVGLISLSILDSIYCQTTDIRLPPTITQDPLRQYNYRGEDEVQLNCKAFGIPPVDYEWKKNGADLNLNVHNIKRLADGAITIAATAIDQGYYQCFAKNQYGTALSNTSYIQMAVLSGTREPTVSPKSVTQGEPFFIQNQPVKSVPPPTFMWESAADTIDTNPTALALSKRVQLADNGDLYFAYAIPEDSLNKRIYKCTSYNEYLDFRSGGSYTSVTVQLVPGVAKKFAPTVGFSSPAMTVALEGKETTLRCFFYGNPEPNIEWRGPKNNLPVGRYQFKDYSSKLIITDVQQSDQGDYVCTGTNDNGNTAHTLQIKVEAKPKFVSFADRPHDTNATEGNSISFSCKAYAIPDATVTWYRNGKPIDVNAPPKRYAFSADKKTLTIQNLCRNCDDRPDSSQSDLGIIQCNASNIHGYAYGAGYVNVLTKTSVTIMADELKVFVNMNEEKQIEFDCKATSDPLTPVTPKWYLETPQGVQLVYDDPPVVSVKDGLLVIHVIPNNTEAWVKYEGAYKCIANNNYSSAEGKAEIKINDHKPTVVAAAGLWWIPLLIILLILLLIILIICCCCCLLRNKGDKYDVDDKERKNGNDPEKELKSNDFQDYQRPEGNTLRGSRGSLGSAGKLNSDDEASLLEYGDDPGKFTEDGSFVGAYASNTVERGRGRRE